MEQKTINWGIIGLGKIANKFATDLQTVSGAKLYAVASRTQEKANAFAEKFNATKAYDSYKLLAEDPNIDAVYIATPHTFHKENTLLCLEHGIAVLCEKPFAMNIEEVQEMVFKAKEKNVLLMEALWTYFLPHYNYVLNIIENKTYGKLQKLEADFGFYRTFDDTSRLYNKSLGGGSLLDIGIYPIFAALSSLGIPENIEAKATYFDNGADSSCDIIFQYDNGATAHLKSSLLEDLPTEATFQFERATVKINGMFHQPSTVTITTQVKEETIDFGYDTIGYNYETIHFNELLRQGKTESDIMTFNFSEQLINTLDKVRALINLNY
ncbi:Gfo/Idh/MocA family oxidoreductase [Tamlana sp. 2_MG-2023]|uniref:Gfo/Idh/MocA family protein n=1 Tax=unclassified Tamlana TaxID=2614803 RepID=UPI0026E26888|nr:MULTISPECIES: Gfo/Idh/MocA family oxidoreductase [unclassified Tamlana]MDO6759185.1 Gfo/Idh/MocA family oxidoreductase [Tamlana sp. 2_MG-2023]MDO6790676.1 Gfo/Idh/MocA family oxidoreductase [Tamlana sp. 1_MG-2023]